MWYLLGSGVDQQRQKQLGLKPQSAKKLVLDPDLKLFQTTNFTLLVIRNTNWLRYLAFYLTFGQPGFYTVQPKRLPVIYSITVAVTVSVQDSFYLLNLQVSLI